MPAFWQYAKSVDGGYNWVIASPFGTASITGVPGQGAFAYCHAMKTGLEVIGGNDRNGVGKFGRSTDGGVTWTVTNPLSASVQGAAFSPDGGTLAICGGGTGGGNTTSGNPEIGISTNDGASFATSHPMWDACHTLTNFWQVNPNAIAFGSDFIMAIGTCETVSGGGTGSWKLVVCVSTDGGSTWTTTISTPFSNTTTTRSIPTLTILPDDTIILIGIKDDSPTRNWMATSTNRGVTWGNLQVSPGDKIEHNASGTIICDISLSSDAAVSWSTFSNPFPTEGIGDVAIADDGTLMMVSRIGYKMAISSDSGSTWTVHQVVASDGTHVENPQDCRFGSYITVGAGWGDPVPIILRPDPASTPGLLATYHNGQWHIHPSQAI